MMYFPYTTLRYHDVLSIHFNGMTYFLTTWYAFWSHDIIFDRWNTFWVMTYVIRSCHTFRIFDVMTYLFIIGDVMTYSLTSWRNFGRHNILFDVMKYFLTLWQIGFDVIMYFLRQWSNFDIMVYFMYFLTLWGNFWRY